MLGAVVEVGVSREEGKGAGSAQRDSSSGVGVGDRRRLIEVLRESVIITEVGLEGVGDVMGWFAGVTVGVVFGVDGWFAALDFGAVLVGDSGSVLVLSRLLGQVSLLNPLNLYHIGWGLLLLVLLSLSVLQITGVKLIK